MLRISTASNFARVLSGLRYNQGKLLGSQEQAATGLRILRPSDDPVGAARSLSLTRRISGVDRHLGAAGTAQALLDQGATALQDASTLLTEARALLLQAMNGTLSQDNRDSIAGEFEVLRREMLDLANSKAGDRYLFGGTLSGKAPWVEQQGDGFARVVYGGNEEELSVQIGDDVEFAVNIPGSDVFGKSEHTGTSFAGLTGLAGGTTADEGSGYQNVILRHDSTDPGDLATVGITSVDGGAKDTLLGSQSVVIDAAAGTIRLGDGPTYKIPGPGEEGADDFRLVNEKGGEMRVDLTGYTGDAFTGTVTGAGSISIDGSTFTAIDFTETDLELKHPQTGTILHVDTTEVLRAGKEVVSFGGASNVFDALQGIAEDLQNSDDLSHGELLQRLNLRLEELDRNAGNVGVSLGVLGSRSARVQATQDRLRGVDLQLQGLLSETRDADLAEAVTTMVRAEQTLQVAQATGVRLIQTSLLNFLR